ncbi:MAG TPA: GtrA family protein [Anaerolineaceae bacterium]|jgi:putative flippase GtrA|nr:GtrA family protein [Longilinea sp.]HNS36336.1 GtrA family protein [Anaerolineaceae bacterium]HNZ12043.1 GtrA family protein [Anaerolineaceae bacterium]HOD05997.1 GtrA family protein [Anaerolineaceae bacterium]HOG78137.1 GtrA family protein [Anaerolineaceae bacterium]
MILTNERERTRFLRFAVVGTIGAVIDFGIFNLLIWLGMRAIVASAISFIAAVISNFLWNRYWTYPDSRSKPLARQMVQFLLVSLVGLGIRAGLFAILEIPLISLFEKLALPLPLSAAFLGHNLTLAIAILIVLLWNFLANRYWTYNDVSK